MSVAFIVRTGARDESDDVAGVSHFLEHMCFKGTPRRSADDVNREFDEIGAHYNAFTSEECTAYYASVLPEYQEPSVDLLADILRPSLRPDDFDMEKKVILEEIQMYLDQPPFGMDDRIKQLHLGGHPLAQERAGHVGERRRSDARADARLFHVALQRRQRVRGGGGKGRFRRAGGASGRALRRLEAGRRATRYAAGRFASRGSKSCIARPRRSSTCCSLPMRRRRKMPIATRPSCWPRSSATIRAAACIGSWSISGLAETASLGHYEYLGRRHVLHVAGLRAGPRRRESVAAARHLSRRSKPTASATTSCGRRRTR